MGIPLMSTSGLETPAPQLPNPNPKRFQVLQSQAIGRFLLLKVRYPDCTNFEGLKILVFKDTNLNELLAQGAIDPHFSDSEKYRHPIARFIPTDDGWDMAKQFCRT